MYWRCSSATSRTRRAPARSRLAESTSGAFEPKPCRNASMIGSRAARWSRRAGTDGDARTSSLSLVRASSCSKSVGSVRIRSAAVDVTSSVRLTPSGPRTTRALTSTRLSSPSGSAANDSPRLRNRVRSVMSARLNELCTAVIRRSGIAMGGASGRGRICRRIARTAAPTWLVRSSTVVTTGSG